MGFERFQYAFESIAKRLDGRHNLCPSCGSHEFLKFGGKWFRKFPTELRCCRSCSLLYRYPTTLEDESMKFYELEYVQPGLTTDLPDDRQLEKLVGSNFIGSEKDFSSWFELFRRISVQLGRQIKVLDYGANWGYAVRQIGSLEFVSESVGYEYSKLRSSFGARHLGVKYITEDQFDGSFDIVFSSHVIEHMHSPRIFRKHMDSLLAADGYVVMTCPNGSLSGIVDHGDSWRRLWGKVHPNMISDEYLIRQFDGYRGSIANADLSEASLVKSLESCTTSCASFMPTTSDLLAILKRNL